MSARQKPKMVLNFLLPPLILTKPRDDSFSERRDLFVWQRKRAIVDCARPCRPRPPSPKCVPAATDPRGVHSARPPSPSSDRRRRRRHQFTLLSSPPPSLAPSLVRVVVPRMPACQPLQKPVFFPRTSKGGITYGRSEGRSLHRNIIDGIDDGNRHRDQAGGRRGSLSLSRCCCWHASVT